MALYSQHRFQQYRIGRSRIQSPIQRVRLLVLVSREIAGFHSINSFVLNIERGYIYHVFSLTIPNLTRWVNLIVQRNLQHLHLLLHLLRDFNDDDDNDDILLPKLPNSVFTCKTLVILNLSCFSLKRFFFFFDWIWISETQTPSFERY